MNWEALGAIGSLANALAVLSTLVYLAIQVRQNTKQIEENTNAVRASAVHASLNFTFSNRAAVFSDEGTAEIYERGVENIDSLNSTERLRFRLMMNNVFDAYLNMYSQTESTGFSPTTWKAQVFLFKARPANQRWNMVLGIESRSISRSISGRSRTYKEGAA